MIPAIASSLPCSPDFLISSKPIIHNIEPIKPKKKDNINPTIINARFLKPLDNELIQTYINKCKVCGSVEENVNVGGLYTAINGITDKNIECFALPCEPIKQGTVEEIKRKYGIDGQGIADKILKIMDKQVL